MTDIQCLVKERKKERMDRGSRKEGGKEGGRKRIRWGREEKLTVEPQETTG